MAKTSSSAAVADLIDLAANKTGWSLAKLNRHLEKGENTLHRWRAGKVESFDLGAIVELCRLAETSLDEAFGSGKKGPSQTKQDVHLSGDPEWERRLSALESTIESMKPLAQIVDSFGAIVARNMVDPKSQVKAGPPELSSQTTGIFTAHDKIQKAATEVRQTAAELEESQKLEEA